MKTIYKIKHHVDNAIGIFLGVVLLVMALLVCASIVFRVMNRGIAWVDELVRVGVIWTTFFGAYVAISKNKEIRVDILVNRFSARTQNLLKILTDLIVLFFLVVFIRESFVYVSNFSNYKLPITELPQGVMYSIFPIGSCMMGLHYVLSLISSIKGLIKGGPSVQGPSDPACKQVKEGV